jgi:site-specific recombinase XerD
MELLARYQTLLASKRRTPRYVRETTALIHRLLHQTEWALNEDAILLALAGLREKGLSVCTTNRYTVCVKAFATWLTRRGFFYLNPLTFLHMLNPKVDRRHQRAAFSDEEIERLLATTHASKFSYMGVIGPARAVLYLAALSTGLREATLAVVTVGQFVLDGPNCYVKVLAEQLKDQEDLIIPLHPASGDRLREWFKGKPADDLAFKTPPHSWNFVGMLRRDLLGAKIVYCEESILPNGRIRRKNVKDFHALRVSAATRWLREGMPLSMAQRMLGHATPEMTDKYTHPTASDLRAAVDRLPALPGLNPRY